MKFSVLWRTVVAWLGGILLTIILIPPGLLLLAFDPIKQRTVQWMIRLWGQGIMRMCFIPIRVTGLENLKDVKSVVFAANHQSMVDVFMMVGFLPRRLSFLAKKQTIYIPVIGLLMLLLGHIHVDRANPKRSLRSVERCIKATGGNRSIAIFPEGTRTLDGRMNPFKSGSLKIPLRTGLPVVPVTICGTLNVMPKNTFGVRPHAVAMHIGRPIPTEGLDVKNFRDFVGEVESTIARTKEEIEREHPEVATPLKPANG